jgi:hypothetical protein
MPTERPPLVGEVYANSWRIVPCGQRDGSLRLFSPLSRQEPLLFLPSSSSVVLTRLSGPRFFTFFIFLYIVFGEKIENI